MQMTDTEVTFLSCYNTVGHTRVRVMTLTSPPFLPLSRPWAELSVRLLESLRALSVTTSLPTLTGILPGHTSQDPCLLCTLILFPPL
jgi:hypothetical protein